MKIFNSSRLMALCALSTLALTAQAGNKDRTGQAGASELLVNPWGRSTGVFGQDAAHTGGLEAMRINIAGLASTSRTEIGGSYNRFFNSADISATNAGIAQRLGNAGVLGVNLFSMNYGEIPITTVNNPAGNVGMYRPSFLNITVGFAREFSNSIKAGASVTFINEQISNVSASGMCFDAGVQYSTGRRDNFHFGVVLRNVGTNMKFGGEGFTYNAEAQNNNTFTNTVSMPVEGFQLPTYLQLSTSYDFYLDENRYTNDSTEAPKHRLTPMFAFTSNSFLNDYLGGGVEYAFRETFMLRGGYRYEKSIGDNSFYTGVSAGASVGTTLGSGVRAPKLMLDYSFRPTQRPANGVHAVSLRFMLR
ncbi:MAG: PorV/PorQ family protein [Sphingobacteriales bacterium]|nr:MAG: PorV/PorQ family protein [Sphingobacteriales bacterium]